MSDQQGGLPLVLMVCRGIGDVIWHLPTFRAIAASSPYGKVALAMRPSTRARDLLRVDPHISHVVDLPQAQPSLKQVPAYVSIFRRERPSSIWVMERQPHISFAAWLAGIPERRGYGMDSRWQEMWLNAHPRMPRNTRKLHRIDKLNAFDRLHGFETSREVDLILDPEVKTRVAAGLCGLPRPWVVFGVGASEPCREWSLDQAVEVAARMRDRVGTVFWFGGPAEIRAVKALVAGRDDQPANVQWFDGPLDEGAALMSLADFFLGPDSGPMNLAAAAGTPALGLYGPSPVLTYSSRLHAVVSPDLTMAGLRTDQIVEAAVGLLERRRVAS
jgi:heptosyltransferase-2